jgi:hypothetical protein
MNIRVNKKVIVIAGTVAAVIIVSLLGTQVIRNLHFRISGTEPNVKKVSTISPFLKVSFNRTLSKTGLDVIGNPATLVKSYAVSGKILTINLGTPLQSGRTYSITINRIQSADGEKITNQQFVFKPSYIESTKLSADQQRALLLQQSNGDLKADPILPHLPYSTIDFDLETNLAPDPNNPGPKVKLTADLFINNADAAGGDAAVAKYKQEVRDYISSLGLNPDNYDIAYNVNLP